MNVHGRPEELSKEKSMRYPEPRIIAKGLYPIQDPAGSRSATAEPHAGYPFFKPRREIYVLHGELGRIVDISMGGIRFTYSATDHLPAIPPACGMLFTNIDDYLEEIPLRVLSDKTIFHLLDSQYLLKERNASFGDLTEGQVRSLERFILKNVYAGRCSSGVVHSSSNPLIPPGPDRIGNGLNFEREVS
jgi:hypothetical protein